MMNGSITIHHRREPINGFPRVASKIAGDPDKTGTIYRRFDRLASRALLLMEAEIAELEAIQDKYDEEDRLRGDRLSGESRSKWSTFERQANELDAGGRFVNPGEAKRMKLFKIINDKLEKYYDALARQQALLNLEKPAHTTVQRMRKWFLGEEENKQPQLWGRSQKRFEDVNDLVALKVPANQDRLSLFVLNYFGGFFQADGHHSDSDIVPERSVAKVVAILCSIFSAVVLFGSVISLYFVYNRPYALLGLVGAWTILFALCIGVLTNARRDQVFAATAAYAAVLVVFISPSLGVTGDCNCTVTTRLS
ncbi:hypothetical protein F5Y18DRAFT_112264 [Xylariaceae sp. FL1019]|nr:hypothetical protein F5Y18DRAFT_112264 [Xylariaceae sp. FL1019]